MSGIFAYIVREVRLRSLVTPILYGRSAGVGMKLAGSLLLLVLAIGTQFAAAQISRHDTSG